MKRTSAKHTLEQSGTNIRNNLCEKCLAVEVVKQFLKGQNFYNGAIDGLWGAGTAKGLRRAKNLSVFKNLTTAKMFEKLKLNPICD